MNQVLPVRVFLFLDLICSCVTVSYFADLIISLGGTTQTVGIFVGVRCLFTTVFAPILGSLADKYGRKPFAVFIAFGTLLTAILEYFSSSLTIYFISRIVFGITRACVPISNGSTCDVITSQQEKKQAIATNGAIVGIGSIIGIALGGLLSSFGYWLPSLVNIIIGLISLLWTMFFVKETLKRKEQSKESEISYSVAFNTIKKDSKLVNLFLFHTFLVIISMSLQYAHMEYPRTELDLSPTLRAGIYIFLGIIFSLGQKVLTQMENICGGSVNFVYVGCILSAIFNFTLYFKNLWVFFISETMLSLFSTISIVTLSSVISHSPESLSGSIMGLNEGLSNFSMFLGAFIFPSLMNISPFLPFFIGGAITLLLGLITYRIEYLKPKVE